MKVNIWWVLMVLLMAGCSAPQLKPEASSVKIVINMPDTAQCNYLGEIIGSPGNWSNEDSGSNAALMVVASNDLKNQAYDMGGNTIYLQKVNSTSSWLLGTTSLSLSGHVYHCK